MDLISDWMASLDDVTYDRVLAALNILQAEGPGLGRPLVDNVKGSRFPHMKELRPPSSGRQTIRILFAFDPQREAITLVAGDKTNNWTRWYRKNIPLADDLYEQHLKDLEEGDSHGHVSG